MKRLALAAAGQLLAALIVSELRDRYRAHQRNQRLRELIATYHPALAAARGIEDPYHQEMLP